MQTPTESQSNFNTLASNLSSKFSDSPPTSSPPSLHYKRTRSPDHSYPPTNKPKHAILIPIPNRNKPEKTYAWVDYLDPLGPGPNTLTKFTAPSPEHYPVRIVTPKLDPNDDLSGHGWALPQRWEYTPWEKLKQLITGRQPAILCKSESTRIWCDLCHRRSLLLYIGKEVSLGGGWGKGPLTHIIQHEDDSVVAQVAGPNIRTPSNTAKVRIPISKIHLTREARVTRWYLKLRGTIKSAPRTPEAEEDADEEDGEDQEATT
ncbi:hypothetical protein QCA50_006525 [Cerrena zonata]|uniref:Uncharacterized protein n=1 Tax=Cerrena zonata TaxID=2478898 RepID=A0AAW0G946_9APHY